jgi:hypothetical protein
MTRVLIIALLSYQAAAHTAQTIKADRILIADQFVPRFLDLPKVKVIARGEVWEAPQDSTWDYIEVQDGGVLSISRSRNTTLRFTHLFVLPGGYLNAGVKGSCIPPDVHVEFIVRDVPIDTTRDPFQWGNGLLNFGTQDRCGAEKRAWTTLTGNALAGATVITLADDPNGWRVGDELLLPDMLASSSHRREVPVFITAITGRQITLSKPLDFDHRDILRPDGKLLLHPRVANLTRNVVIRSEGQTTPGHTVDVEHMARWHIADNEIIGLGRTKNIPLDNTSPDLRHIGNNQAGRYADHHHHAMGMDSYTRGSVLRGATGKWGVVVHQTHDAVIADNIAIDFKGAAFITEDGNEARTRFEHNFAAYNVGNHQNEQSNDNEKCPGCTGNGFWFRSRLFSTITKNEAWNNDIGINDFGINQVSTSYPSVPGGQSDTPLQRLTAKPALFADNVAAANQQRGFESWGNPTFQNTNLVLAYNRSLQYAQLISTPTQPFLVNPQIVCQESDNAIGIMSPVAYVFQLDVRGGYIGGCKIGIDDGGAIDHVILEGLTLQNVVNLPIYDIPRSFQHINILHKPLGTHEPRYIEFGKLRAWDGVGPLPATGGVDPWVPQLGTQWSITNWQGTGKNYSLFTPQMRGSLPAWHSEPENVSDQHLLDCPDRGITNLECWTKYGMSFGGDVINDAEIVPLEGLFFGLAKEGSSALGPPRAIVTSPTLRDDATAALITPHGQPVLRIHMQLTGRGKPYDPVLARVDGGAWDNVYASQYGLFPTERSWTVSGDAVRPGIHTVETIRVDSAGNKAAPMTFQYRIGEGGDPRLDRRR